MSMSPLIKEGCELVVDFNKQQDYFLNDIVIFFWKKKLSAHRIVQVVRKGSKKYFILKGDNNPRIDNRFLKSQLNGKVTKIVYPTYEIDLQNNKIKMVNYLLLLYSRLNLIFPGLIKIKWLGQLKPLRKIYRYLLAT